MIAQAMLLLAEAGPDKSPADNPEWGKAAPTGLFMLLALVAVSIFLFRSMNKQIRKVPPSFSPNADAQSTRAAQRDGGGHLGEATAEAPIVDHVDLASQTPPRLGTPDQLLAEQQRKRRERLQKARKSAGRKDHH